MNDQTAEGLTFLTPGSRKRQPFPKIAGIGLVVTLALGIIGSPDHSMVWQVIWALGLVIGLVSSIMLALWVEDSLYTVLVGRHGVFRVLAGFLMPIVAGFVGFFAATLAAALGSSVNDDGILGICLFIGALWMVSAAIGSLIVVLLDTVISALVPGFRTRVQLAVLGLLTVTSALAVGVYMGGLGLAGLVREAESGGLASELDINVGDGDLSDNEVLQLLQREEMPDYVAYGFFILIAVMSVPAILSATGKIAEAVMERLHPLRLGFRSLGEGKLDVRVEEAGSRDFVSISRGFNQMTASLSQTMTELDARNRELVAMNEATTRFVPFQFLNLLGKPTLPDIVRGDHLGVELSILFCDIRGFTTLAEKMGPEATFRFINRYLSFMEPEIHERGGFINDFAGDGIMALFHTGADAAVQAGLGMLSALDRFNLELVAEGRSAVGIGVGINTGPLMLGTIGGQDRLDCTVIGDPANLAARVEGMTRLYGSNLLIAEGTYRSLESPPSYEIREIDRVRAKGKREPVTIYEILDGEPGPRRGQKRTSLEPFAQALALYRNGEFQKAAEAFARCLEQTPHDGAVKVYIERCDALKKNDRLEDWEGVTDLEVK